MLSKMGFQHVPYEVDFISPSNSKNILCSITLGSTNASLPLGIDEIVNMCGGIPLVIELIGQKLKEHLSSASKVRSLKEFFMESIVVGGDVGLVVNEIYRSLDNLSKEAFLHIVFFFDNRPTRQVSVAIGNAQIEVLQDATLVKLYIDDDDKQIY